MLAAIQQLATGHPTGYVNANHIPTHIPPMYVCMYVYVRSEPLERSVGYVNENKIPTHIPPPAASDKSVKHVHACMYIFTYINCYT